MSVSTIVGTCRDYLPITPNLNNLVHRDNYETYMSGSATKEALRAGGSASGRYEVLTGGASVDIGMQTMFHDQYSYALFEAQ